MIVLIEDPAGTHTQRVRLLDRLVARFLACRLDKRLAEGASPESTVALALHAAFVTRPSQLLPLARSLERLVSATETTLPNSGTVLSVPINRDALRRAKPDLEALSRRLRSVGLMNVRGVAMARLLLADGAGPLYQSCASRDLRDEVHLALAQMERVM
ncbi:MAG TPA: hypothetical protein VEJ84_06335 [Acidimicrobiales bacterium]|nr:hypothetical protein [Acidimicrobiales bacterium]